MTAETSNARGEWVLVPRGLLEAAVCPMKESGCDGTQYPVQPYGEGEQCQWCCERRSYLTAPPPAAQQQGQAVACCTMVDYFNARACDACSKRVESFALKRAAPPSAPVGVPEGWPKASEEDASRGWTLDYGFLDRVTDIAKSRTDYTTSAEASEQVLIAALEVLATTPKPTAGESSPVGVERKYPDDGNGDDDAYNRGWNDCLDALAAQPGGAE